MPDQVRHDDESGLALRHPRLAAAKLECVAAADPGFGEGARSRIGHVKRNALVYVDDLAVDLGAIVGAEAALVGIDCADKAGLDRPLRAQLGQSHATRGAALRRIATFLDDGGIFGELARQAPVGRRLAIARTLAQSRPGRSEERRVGKECVRTVRTRWSP